MTVDFEVNNKIATITLNRPESLNAMTPEMYKKLSESWVEVRDNPDIWVAVIAGAGQPNRPPEKQVFCAGADMNSFQEAIENDSIGELVMELTGVLHPLLVRIRGDPTVVVAAINGAAAGGGLGLALACDTRIASTDAKLASAFFRLGLSPDGGTTWLLPRLVGVQRARSFLFNDETWTAATAMEAGALDEVVEPEELLPRAIQVATDWGKWSNNSKKSIIF